MRTTGFQDIIGEGGAAAVFLGLADAHLGRAADIERPAPAEGLEEAVEEDLCFAFLVAFDVLGGPIDEGLEFGGADGIHGAGDCVRQ